MARTKNVAPGEIEKEFFHTARPLLGKSNAPSLQESTNYYFLTTYTVITKPIVEALLARYPIERNGSRNNVLMELIGDLIHKFGREASELIVKQHYRR
jgi:hypothetical protein